MKSIKPYIYTLLVLKKFENGDKRGTPTGPKRYICE